ncbi:MAG: AAA family ATPase [Pseudonocardiaceae bacterium]
MIIVTTANLKGGSTKTTSAVFASHVLAERGQRVLLVDADPQGSALRWHEYAGGFPFPVVRLDSGRLHRDLIGITGDRYDAVVIDTPPLEDHKGIVVSAIRAATHALIPCAPTPMEYERLAAVRSVLEEAADLRRDNSEPISAVLLTRTVAGAASTGVHREMIAEDGWHVLAGSVGRLEAFSQAYGDPIKRASATAYGDAVTELLGLAAVVSS